MARDPRRAAPPDGEKVLDWYGESFDAVFCVLHPFIRVSPENAAVFLRDDGPTRSQVSTLAAPVSWKSVVDASSKTKGYLELDCLLRQIKGVLREADYSELDELRCLFDKDGLLLPEKGGFSPLQLDTFLAVFNQRCSGRVIVGDEFGLSERMESADSLLSLDYPVVGEAHPVLFPADHSILVATHWDSFHTFYCGNRDWIEDDVQVFGLEGFFCDRNTKVPLYETAQRDSS